MTGINPPQGEEITTDWIGKLVRFSDQAIMIGEIKFVTISKNRNTIDFDLHIATKATPYVSPLTISFRNVDRADFAMLFELIPKETDAERGTSD